MKDKLIISVIVPIYNAEDYLEETILSVLEQSFQQFELILVNHNSSDSSATIIQKYATLDSRIVVVSLDINRGGPAYPRNEGLKVAQGEYVAFVDSDDVWIKEKLQKEYDFIQKEDVDIVYTLAYTTDAESQVIGQFANQRVYNILKYLLPKESIIYYTNYININSVLMKNDKDISFSEDINLVAMEDWKLWIESLYLGKKVLLLEEKLLKYRVHSASASKRESDIGYRKSLYLLSLLFLQKKIPLGHFMLSSMITIFKIVIKNLRG